MSHETDIAEHLNDLRFFITPPHECSYFPERQAATLFTDPAFPMDTATYSVLSSLGFRRSADHVYRPQCRACQACIPIRIPVQLHTPDRTMQRVLKNNHDLHVVAEQVLTKEGHDLYERYILARHHQAGMHEDFESYQQLIRASWCETRHYAIRLDGHLVGVAITDHLTDGLSAVYTFFDPSLPKRSLGTFAILWQIAECRRLGLPYLYLGYWIKESPKMAYKVRFHPLDFFNGQAWHPLPRQPRIIAKLRQ